MDGEQRNRRRREARSKGRDRLSALSEHVRFMPGLRPMVARSVRLLRQAEMLAGNVAFHVVPGLPQRTKRNRTAILNRWVADLGQTFQLEASAHPLSGLVSVAGPAAAVRDLIGGPLILQARHRALQLRSTYRFLSSFEPPEPSALFLAPAHSLRIRGLPLEGEPHALFIPPPVSFQPYVALPSAPVVDFFIASAEHVRQALNIVDDELSGDGVRIAVVDTGFAPHPFYEAGGFRFDLTHSGVYPLAAEDEIGHGTAICWNIFCVAPRATVLGFRYLNDPLSALRRAVDSSAEIISCSWGFDHEQAFPEIKAEIDRAVGRGKLVVFASGNGAITAWPAGHPDILAVGGVYADPDGALSASDYASGFISSAFSGRIVPDVAGLCGPSPMGRYLMLPCPPFCDIDRRYASEEGGDRTMETDGWAAMSGTSSAAPQVAGAAALLIEAARRAGRALPAREIKEILMRSATPVSQGKNAFGLAANGLYGPSVGRGLVNVAAALEALR